MSGLLVASPWEEPASGVPVADPGTRHSGARGDAHMRRLLCAGLVASVVATAVVLVTSSRTAIAAPPVVINELHYHPADDNPAAEFLELYNPTGGAVDLTGWCFDGINYCFPAGSVIGPAGFVVITPDQYGGALSNSGEEIILIDSTGDLAEGFTYDDAELWPASADGHGASLQRRDPLAVAESPGNWVSGGPTPGAPNAGVGGGLMPVFSDVSHTVLPGPGDPIEVTANLVTGSAANIAYRVGFGPETEVPMAIDGAGTATATIPGQGPGELIRYRLAAWSPAGVVGTWPRQGDGSVYSGTTVATATTSKLPRFEWFMDDAVYDTAVNDLSLEGDDGYPTVFAYAGTIFDGAKVRVKGQVSRNFPKKKWKMVLPAGHELSIPGVLPEPVDEFALHSSWSDKSFIRETLAAEAMARAGVPASQAFPVRLERNGSFYGLYSYVEQPDGTWRERFGLDESVSYEVGGGDVFGVMSASDASLSQDALRQRYEKETQEYADDDALRNLISQLNGLSGGAERQWIYDNIDVPSMINALAASVVIQHQDWGAKNYRLVLSPQGRWQVFPSDFDLVFGRRWTFETGALGDPVSLGAAFEHPGYPLFTPFWFDPEFSAMLKRRIRTLTEQLLDPPAIEGRIAQLADLVRDEAALDRSVWGTYGASQTSDEAAVAIITGYTQPQYNRILGPFAGSGRVANNPQPAIPNVRFDAIQYPTGGDASEFLVLRNDSTDTVDLSQFTISEIELTIAGGTVLLPGHSVVFVNEDYGSTAGAFCCLVGGTYAGSLEDSERYVLRNPAGDVVRLYNLVRAGSMTQITGAPNSSAIVSLISTEAAGPGYLQVLPCGSGPGGTSNLNTDRADQTIAGLAVVNFDANGHACVFNYTATHIVVDLQAYLQPGAIDDIADQRIIDTRSR